MSCARQCQSASSSSTSPGIPRSSRTTARRLPSPSCSSGNGRQSRPQALSGPYQRANSQYADSHQSAHRLRAGYAYLTGDGQQDAESFALYEGLCRWAVRA